MKISFKRFIGNFNTKQRCMKRFSTNIGGLSTDMQISLSMGQNNNKEIFKTNKDLIESLQKKKFITSECIEHIFTKLKREQFSTLEHKNDSDQINGKNEIMLNAEAVNLKKNVDLTSSMMQAIMLSLVEIILKSDNNIKKIHDIGCANGFLTFGILEILNFFDTENSKKIDVFGIDQDDDAINCANILKKKLNFEEKKITFLNRSFEGIDSSKQISSNNQVVLGFGVEKKDILARIQLNPDLNELWILAPIFNNKNEQDLCIICPNDDKITKIFEKIFIDSGIPFDLQKDSLDDEYSIYKIMTCFFSPGVNSRNITQDSETQDVNSGEDINNNYGTTQSTFELQSQKLLELENKIKEIELTVKQKHTEMKKSNKSSIVTNMIENDLEIKQVLKDYNKLKTAQKILLKLMMMNLIEVQPHDEARGPASY